MTQLGRQARALLDAARHGDDPTHEDRARMRARLHGSLAPAAAAMIATAATAKAAPAAVGVTSKLSVSTAVIKAVFVTAIFAGITVGGVGWRMLQRQSAPSSSAPSLPSVNATIEWEHERPPALAAPAVSLSDPAAPTLKTKPLASAGRTEALEGETRLLREADIALRGGRADAALALLDEHASRYPRGVLTEERAAERVLALCMLGRGAEARREGFTFLRDHPRSPLADRVRLSCAVPP